MPIHFRCVSCRKLLGIARRKAGTVVRCPDCATELIVPTEVTSRVPARAGVDLPRPDRRERTPPAVRVTNGHGPAPLPEPPKSMPLFERPDFESLLNPAVKQAEESVEPPRPVPVQAKEAPPPAPPPKPVAQKVVTAVVEEDAYDLEPVGLVISKQNLTVMAVVVVVLIGLAFAAGYLLAAARLPAAG